MFRELNYLNYVFMFEIPSLTPQMDSWTKYLEAYIFLTFLREFKILLPLLFEVFWIDILFLIM